MSGLGLLVGDTLRSAWRRGAWPALGVLTVLAAWLLASPSVGGSGGPAWSLSMGGEIALLLLGVGWLAVDALSSDLVGGTASLLAVRPLPRWLWWLSRWLGTTLIGWSLLPVAVGVVWLRVGQPPPAATMAQPAGIAQPLVLEPGQPVRVTLPPAAGALRLTVYSPNDDGELVELELRADNGSEVSVQVLPGAPLATAWPGGTLTITNHGSTPLTIWSGRDLSLEQPAGPGWANGLRACLLAAGQIALVAALGAALAAALPPWLSLLAVMAWLLAAAHAPLLPSGGPDHLVQDHHHHAVPAWSTQIVEVGTKLGRWLAEPLGRWWAWGPLGRGETVAVGEGLLTLVLLTGVATLQGMVAWNRRELGAGDRL